jgi:hypothetical protein
MEVVLSGGKEYAAVEAMRASASRARSGANVPSSGLRFFYFLFLKTDFGYRLGTADTKNNLFFVS